MTATGPVASDGIRRVGPPQAVPRTQAPRVAGERTGRAGASFEQVLGDVLAQATPLRFSAHAQRRLQDRRISLGEAQRTRLAEATARAESKGAREAVVVLDHLAFVVSVTNRTVITVADEAQLKENVFTNIDSVVFA